MGSLLLILVGLRVPASLQLRLTWLGQEKILTLGSIGAPTASSLEEVDSLSLSSAKSLDCIIPCSPPQEEVEVPCYCGRVRRSTCPRLHCSMAWEVCQGWRLSSPVSLVLIPSCRRLGVPLLPAKGGSLAFPLRTLERMWRLGLYYSQVTSTAGLLVKVFSCYLVLLPQRGKVLGSFSSFSSIHSEITWDQKKTSKFTKSFHCKHKYLLSFELVLRLK